MTDDRPLSFGDGFYIGLFVGIVALLALMFFTGAMTEASDMRQAAIDHNAAHYDSKTGKWQWNEELKP